MKKSQNRKAPPAPSKKAAQGKAHRSAAPFLVHSENVIFRSSNSQLQGTSIIDIERAKIYTLNQSGTFIWNLIDGKKTASDIIDALSQKFSITPKLNAQIEDFIIKMIHAELVDERKTKSRNTVAAAPEINLSPLSPLEDSFMPPVVKSESLDVLNVFAAGPGH